MTRFLSTFGVVVALAALPLPAAADSITFAGSSGSLAASVTFAVDGLGNLTVTLTNTSAGDVLVPADLLTAVFFNLGDPTLTRVSAELASGSTVFNDAPPALGVVGGEWAYGEGLVGAPGGATKGISSVGLGLFGAGDLFPGPDLDGPASPNGDNYGLLSAGDNFATGNPQVIAGGLPLIKNSVVFTLSGLDCGSPTLTGPSIAAVSVAECGIGDVSFQYGSALTDPNIPGDPGNPVPEPGTLLLLGAGLSGLAGLRRRRG